MRRTIRLSLTAALAASVVVALPATADSHVETVLTGVDNPRGLTIDGNGDLFVAASGIGGGGPCTEGPEGAELCYGETGHVHDVRNVSAAAGLPLDAEGEILIDALPSLAEDGGVRASGPADVFVNDGTLYYTIGLGADPAVRNGDLAPAAKADRLATLWAADASDAVPDDQLADLGDHEADDDPDDAGPDSNPFGVVATSDTAYVLDAGGNALIQVDLPVGTTSTHTVFPPTPVPSPGIPNFPHGSDFLAEAVPTQLALRDGGFDVGQLTGFPFHPGAASVWRVDDGTPSVLQTGFSSIMDVAWHGDDLYVLEIFHNGPPAGGDGALIRVSTDGDTVTRELLMDNLNAPGGMAFDPTDDGMLYVSTGSAGPDGSVIRFDATAADPLVTVVDDAATTQEDQRLVAGDAEADAYQSVVGDVTDNDTGLTLAAVIDNASGAVYEEGGNIIYQPPAHFVGEDTITYVGCNDDGHCLVGVLGVTITETEVDRIAGGTRIQTAIEASQGRFPNGASVVVVARADLYPDALAGGPLANAADAPILLTSRDGLDEDVADEIRRLAPTQAYLLGGPVALSTDVEAAVSALVDETDRLEGGDRFATAVAIRDELAVVTGVPAAHAYVVEGADPDPTRGWPDAVAVSALASWHARPILLVETDRMPEVTAQALDGLDATIIGGPVAIGAAVTDAIEDAADAVDRLAGDTRYETSRLVAERSFEEGLMNVLLTLVSGGNWPDALVAGPLVAQDTGGFMLVHPNDLSQSPETVRFIDDHGPFIDIDLLGGTDAISAEVAAGIEAANSD